MVLEGPPEPPAIFTTDIVPGENDVDQDPCPLPKCFWSLLEEVGGYFVIAAGFAICHSSNIARELPKRFSRFWIVSHKPMVLYEKMFDLSRKSMLFTSFLLEPKLSVSRPAHTWYGQ